MDGMDGEIVATIQRCLNQLNPFVEMFLRAAELVTHQEVLNVRLTINEAPGVDLRTRCDEVTAIILDANVGGEGFIILYQRGRELQRISDRPTIHRSSLCCSHAVN